MIMQLTLQPSRIPILSHLSRTYWTAYRASAGLQHWTWRLVIIKFALPQLTGKRQTSVLKWFVWVLSAAVGPGDRTQSVHVHYAQHHGTKEMQIHHHVPWWYYISSLFPSRTCCTCTRSAYLPIGTRSKGQMWTLCLGVSESWHIWHWHWQGLHQRPGT